MKRFAPKCASARFVWSSAMRAGTGRAGRRAGIPAEMTERLKALERENRELRQANQTLREASAYLAMADLDRRSE